MFKEIHLSNGIKYQCLSIWDSGLSLFNHEEKLVNYHEITIYYNTLACISIRCPWTFPHFVTLQPETETELTWNYTKYYSIFIQYWIHNVQVGGGGQYSLQNKQLAYKMLYLVETRHYSSPENTLLRRWSMVVAASYWELPYNIRGYFV